MGEDDQKLPQSAAALQEHAQALADFGVRLGAALEAQGLTRQVLAQRTGLSRVTMGLWLRGEVEPQLFAADAVAQALATPLVALLGEVPAPQRAERPLPPSAFAERLAVCMGRHGVSVPDLARLSDVDKSSLKRWKAGTTEPRLLAIYRVARALEVSLDVLLGYLPLPPATPAQVESMGRHAAAQLGITVQEFSQMLRAALST